jgi:uncharacterized pyridoxamine 5'-phosphate oxidase family protein
MAKLYDELSKADCFFLSTMEGLQPRVRPFGAVASINGKVYIGMTNKKNVYNQVKANPQFEISAVLKDGAWLRVSGVLIEDDSEASRRVFLDTNPGLKKMYSPKDGLFTVFYFDKISATKYSFSGPSIALD